MIVEVINLQCRTIQIAPSHKNSIPYLKGRGFLVGKFRQSRRSTINEVASSEIEETQSVQNKHKTPSRQKEGKNMKIKVTYIDTKSNDPYERLKGYSKDELIAIIKDQDYVIGHKH